MKIINSLFTAFSNWVAVNICKGSAFIKLLLLFIANLLILPIYHNSAIPTFFTRWNGCNNYKGNGNGVKFFHIVNLITSGGSGRCCSIAPYCASCCASSRGISIARCRCGIGCLWISCQAAAVASYNQLRFAIIAFFAAIKTKQTGYSQQKYKFFHTSKLTLNYLNRQMP